MKKITYSDALEWTFMKAMEWILIPLSVLAIVAIPVSAIIFCCTHFMSPDPSVTLGLDYWTCTESAQGWVPAGMRGKIVYPAHVETWCINYKRNEQ